MVEKEEVKNKKKKELALIKLFFSEIGAVFKIFCFEIEGWECVPEYLLQTLNFLNFCILNPYIIKIDIIWFVFYSPNIGVSFII